MLDKIGCVILLSYSIGVLEYWNTGKRKKSELNPTLQHSICLRFSLLQLLDERFHIGFGLLIREQAQII
jgi:hypothetical protein